MSQMTLRSFLHHRVTRLSLLVSIGIGALFTHTMWTMKAEQWTYHVNTNTNLSTTVAKGLEWSLNAVDASLQKAVGDLQNMQTLEVAQLNHIELRALREAMWDEINSDKLLVLDRDGQLLNKPQGALNIGKHYFAYDFFQAFTSQGHKGIFIGHPTRNLLMGEYVLPIARSVFTKNGTLSGVVVGWLPMQEVIELLSGMNLGPDSGLNVIREDGLILVRFPYKETTELPTLAGTKNMARFVANEQGNFVSTAVIDGIRRLYTHNRVGPYPMIVNVAQSKSTILKDWKHNAWLLGIFAGLLMLSCMGLAWLFVHELTRRHRSENELFIEKERIRLTLQSIGDAVVCTDAYGCITYMNPTAEDITGLILEEVLYKPFELLHDSQCDIDLSSESSSWRKAYRTRFSTERLRTSVHHYISGALLDIEVTTNVVKSIDGQILGAVSILRDVTDAVAHESRILRLAYHDSLTGLPNRRLLEDRAQQAMAHCKRVGKKMAVVYLDLDGFKQINDSLGHEAGDAAILHTANSLKSCSRESDTVCRLGGDEFVLLLTGVAHQEHLLRIVNKFRAFNTHPFIWNDQEFQLSFSGGVALFPDHSLKWEQLLSCADSAMYSAKQAGRNQIRFYQSDQEATLLAEAEIVG